PRGTVEVDKDHVELRRRAGDVALRGVVHDGLAQVEPAAGEGDDRLVGIDQGRRALGQAGAQATPHSGTADAEQHGRYRPLAYRKSERHQSLVMEDEAGGVEQI